MTAFPSFFEFLRFILNSFDISFPEKKALDEAVIKVDADYRLIAHFIEKGISGPLSKYVSNNFSREVKTNIELSFNEYRHLINEVNCDGLSPEAVRSTLISMYGFPILSACLNRLYDDFLIISPKRLLSESEGSVQSVLTVLKSESDEWRNYLSRLNKEDQNRLSSWKRGKSLPSSQSISLLSTLVMGEACEVLDWEGIKASLFLARFIDSIRRVDDGRLFTSFCKGYDLKKDAQQNFHKELITLKLNSRYQSTGIYHGINYLSKKLNLKGTRDSEEKLHHINTIGQIRSDFKKRANDEVGSYMLDWLEARWYVFNGELNSANKLYKDAFKKSVYASGEKIGGLIREALVVASSLQKNGKPQPDKVFLKSLKNYQITMELEIPSVYPDTYQRISSKFEELIQDWEVVHFQACFNDVFPIESFYKGNEILALSKRRGSVNYNKALKIEPNYRNINKKLHIGFNEEKTIHQLTLFVQREEKDYVRELLSRGARVDVLSDAGESPLTFALEIMDATDFPGKTLDPEYFDWISKTKNVQRIVNVATQKKRLLPLIQAVKTGKPWIVRRLLELGADPNLRGLSDNVTALRVCISLLGISIDPEGWIKSMDNHPLNDALLDSMRRESNGMMGMNRDSYLSMFNIPLAAALRDSLFRMIAENIQLNIRYDDMYEIFSLLIEYGADSNREYDTPLRGYTPLMLAAELNLRKPFEVMLMNGGDPRKTFFHPGYKKNVDCWQIAEYWKSKDVFNLLKDIEKHLPDAARS